MIASSCDGTASKLNYFIIIQKERHIHRAREKRKKKTPFQALSTSNPAESFFPLIRCIIIIFFFFLCVFCAVHGHRAGRNIPLLRCRGKTSEQRRRLDFHVDGGGGRRRRTMRGPGSNIETEIGRQDEETRMAEVRFSTTKADCARTQQELCCPPAHLHPPPRSHHPCPSQPSLAPS